MALFQEFGDDALIFDLLFWTDDFDHWPRIKSDVAVAVNAALAEAKISIPFPQRDLHLQSITPAVAQALGRPPDEWRGEQPLAWRIHAKSSTRTRLSSASPDCDSDTAGSAADRSASSSAPPGFPESRDRAADLRL